MFCKSAGKLRPRRGGARGHDAACDHIGGQKSKDPRTHDAFERGSDCEVELRARAESARLYLGLTGYVASAKRADNPKHPRWSHAVYAPSLPLLTLRDLCPKGGVVKVVLLCAADNPNINFSRAALREFGRIMRAGVMNLAHAVGEVETRTRRG